MIDEAAITAWGVTAPWVTRAQVEQDLLLSRLIVEIASHPYLGLELVFRGGTCLHKLHLGQARRYSEDLDYVRSTATGIGPMTTALTSLGEQLGFEVRTSVGRHPKVFFRTEATDGSRLRLKIEVNTYERSPAEPLVLVPFAVSSAWFTGEGQVRTFTPAELVATKIRALYQRKKGRDLFDLWLALTEMGLTGAALVAAFGPYRPDGLTTATAVANLRRKLDDSEFRDDLLPLVGDWPPGYNVDTAAELVMAEVHSQL